MVWYATRFRPRMPTARARQARADSEPLRPEARTAAFGRRGCDSGAASREQHNAGGTLPAYPMPPLPSEDKRWKIVNGTMRRHGFARNALIETLHTAQSSFGYLDDEAIRFVARSLHVPLSQAYGVVTFYHHFSLKPAGKHTCTVCLGTACYIK